MALAVKKVCRLAYREGLTERQLFAHVEIERGENKNNLVRALDRASLDKLQALTFEPYEVELETARNLFSSPVIRALPIAIWLFLIGKYLLYGRWGCVVAEVPQTEDRHPLPCEALAWSGAFDRAVSIWRTNYALCSYCLFGLSRPTQSPATSSRYLHSPFGTRWSPYLCDLDYFERGVPLKRQLNVGA